MNIITDTKSLEDICQKLAQQNYMTIDTEFIREKTYFPNLCLIQVANDDVEAIIDPLADGIDGPRVMVTDSIMKNDADRARLAQEILSFSEQF